MIAIPTAIFLPTATADGAGLSGQCYNADASSGGQDNLRYDTNDGLTVLTVTGAVNAATMLVLGTIADGGNTGSACDRYDCYTDCESSGLAYRYDYVEGDVSVAGNDAQVCYRGTAYVGLPSAAGGTGIDCPRYTTGTG